MTVIMYSQDNNALEDYQDLGGKERNEQHYLTEALHSDYIKKT